jgi:hypothetical protein
MRLEELSMEFTPDPSPSKRTRARSKAAAASSEAKPAVVKKTRAPRKKSTAAGSAAEASVAVATPTPMPENAPKSEDIGSMIATAAYYLAEARNFSPGHELDDWLAAERAIHARLYG